MGSNWTEVLSLVKILWSLIIFQILSNAEGDIQNLALNLLGFIRKEYH